MQSRGPLMIEHRLIERMISQVDKTLENISHERSVDPHFIDIAVDFVRTYADRTHHGKEEDILFRLLESRPLSGGDRRVMGELMEEHAFGRQTTRVLIEANNRYRNGDQAALADVSGALQTLVEFYPKHIQKEDKVFFPAVRSYLTEEEDRALLAAFHEFDSTMIHRKYQSVVEAVEQAMSGPNKAL